MPRKKLQNRQAVERRSEMDDDDFLFEENSGRGTHEPQQRNAANARERARMRVLSKAFCRCCSNTQTSSSSLDIDDCHSDEGVNCSSVRVGAKFICRLPRDEDYEETVNHFITKASTPRLKTTLPWVPADTKLSKLDTLRLAASYIAHLRALLQEEPRAAAQMFPHPLNLAWPFAFQPGGVSTIASISPRWSSDTSTSSSCNPPTVTRDSPQTIPYTDNYHDGLKEVNYENCEDIAENEQFCRYNQYKDKYFAMRKSYVTNNLTNNV